MKSRGIARVGLLASGLVAGAMMVSAPGIASSEPLNAPSAASSAIDSDHNGNATAGVRGNYVQRLGCEKASKPACNKPGRRSSRR
jgi:hypothetical protein